MSDRDLLEAGGAAEQADRRRQALAAGVFAVPAKAGPVMCGSAMVLCEQFDREPCPHKPERRCDSCPGGNAKRATPPQPGEGGA